MKIEVQRIHRLNAEGSLKGFADVSIEDSFLIKGLRIVSGKEGLFVSMPREMKKNGSWYNTVVILNEKTKILLSNLVLSAYTE